MGSIRLYGKYFSIYLRSILEYKLSFFLTMLGQFIFSFTSLLAVYFLMDRFHSVEGFTLPEVLLCYGAVITAFSLSECFFRGFDRFSVIIGNGQFDRILVRPRGLVLQVLGSQIDLARLGKLVQALLVLLYAVPNSGVRWTPLRGLGLALMIAGGAAFFCGMFLVYAGLCFFTLEGLEFINVFTDGARQFGQYPLSVYGKRVLALTTFVVPLACAQYYPLLYVLGRTDSPWMLLSPLAAAAFLLPCLLIWRFGVRHYRSTGS